MPTLSPALSLSRWPLLSRLATPLHFLPVESDSPGPRTSDARPDQAPRPSPAWLTPAYQRRLTAGDRWADELGLRPRTRR